MKMMIIALLLYSVTATARVFPETGLWDDPDASGRGVTIEIQNGILVATYFGYNQNGNAQWWQGAAFEGPENVYSGSLGAVRDGQCIGCDYTFPTIDNNNSAGDFSITFHSSSDATLDWAGGTNYLLKNRYGHGRYLNNAIGIWTLDAFSGEFGINQGGYSIRIDEIETFEGVDFAIGNLTGFVGNDFPVFIQYLGFIDLTQFGQLHGIDLIGDAFAVDIVVNSQTVHRFVLYMNQSKAYGTFVAYQLGQDPPNLNTFDFLAAGARLLDKYEKEALFPLNKSVKHSKEERVKIKEIAKNLIK